MNAPIQPDEQAAVASAPTFTTNRQAELLNPLIGGSRDYTLFQAACAVEFLSRLHGDLADWRQLADGNHVSSGPSELSANELRGLSMLTKCISAALHFEVEGRI